MTYSQPRIALLSVHSSPMGKPGAGDTGGMSIYIRELARSLVKLGYEIDMYTRAQDSEAPEISEIASNTRLIQVRAGEPADIDKISIYPLIPDFARGITEFTKRYDLHYDLIFSHYWISGIAGQYLQNEWQIPQVIMFHTLGAVKNAIGIGEDEPLLRLEKEKQIANNCQRIIASTERERLFLNRYYDVPLEKIRVIPCGVNLDLFHPMDKTIARQKLQLEEEKLLFFAGRIERLKGIDKIIQALPYLSGINCRLIIAGDDGNRPGEINRLMTLADLSGVSDRITFTGLVEYEKLPYYYNAADICIFPSYYESFGLVPLEALACGIPVIATDVGDLRNIIIHGKNGYILKDNRPELLAQYIRNILLSKNTDIYDVLTIRSSVCQFSWQNIANSIDYELKGIIASNKVLTAS